MPVITVIYKRKGPKTLKAFGGTGKPLKGGRNYLLGSIHVAVRAVVPGTAYRRLKNVGLAFARWTVQFPGVSHVLPQRQS